ncbi:hypothetical protein ARALYDRAFT_333266 [Arabidopsis lyrata subsp. lyrata]|uniref:F-box domain-containing protein n=1 Tax=Arabidopsis lyrata subsp. lyrata TaxID=81972 RepID=D7MX37_ARALL|nr:hypothetical protein ARALYDRAFT_333266 [Arabidopsis lyrata subsp. lyrata]
MTTISDLPRNLVGKILSMVPITCLGAVRCTCKGWNALSKVRILCKAETRHQFVGFMMKKYKLCSQTLFNLHGTFNEEGANEFVYPSIKELGNLFNQVKISRVFQCDGLLLCMTKEDNTRLVVWNPYLGQISYAIGYDNNRNHKILRFVDFYDSKVKHKFLEYEIYDFSSNSWRVLDITPDWEIESYQRGASLKGNTYFIAKEKIIFEEDGEYPEPPDYLLCFDFTTESFGQFLPLPSLFSWRRETRGIISEPNAVSWNPFLKVDMKPHCSFGFHFHYDGGSFFIDEEEKVGVVIHFDASEMTRYEDAAYIIGKNGYVKKVRLGEAPANQGGSLNFKYCCPLHKSTKLQDSKRKER